MLEIGDGWAQELAGCLQRPVFLIAVGCTIWLLLWLARTTRRLKAAIQPLRDIQGRFSTTPSGLRLQGIVVPPPTLRSLVRHGGISIEHFAVAEVELCWPSWQKRLPALRISGLRVQLLQQQAPEGPVPACPAAPAAQQLELLEQLLWQGSASSSSSSSWMSSQLASFALGLLDLRVSDACCLYRQAGELGPAQLGRAIQHQDGVALSIRMLCIEPGSSAAAASGGAWPPDGQPQHEPAAVAAGTGPVVSSRLVSRLSVTGVAVAVMSQQAAAGGSLPARRQPAAAAAAAAAAAGDLAAALAAEGWDMCFVLLQQWQCSVDVLHSSSTQQASQAAQQSQRPAIALKYRAAGVLEGDEQQASTTNTPASSSSSSSRKKLHRSSREALRVRIDMKSLVLLLPPAATAIACRLAARFSDYQQLSPVWAVRPSQPVSAAPALWWQHACTAVLGECRRRRAAGSMRQALARRQHYLALYRALHCRQPNYVQLPRALAATGSKQRLQLPVAQARAALQAAEHTMTACEIATHRIFVALLHSRHLQTHPALQQQWLEALDGLGGFVDLIPGRGQGSSHSEPGLVVSLQCPAVLVTLTSQQQPQRPQLTAEVRGISLHMPDAAQAALVVRQVQVLLGNAASGGSGTVAALQVPAVVGLESYGRSRGSSQAAQAPQQQQSQQDASQAAADPPRLSSLGRIYSSSLIVTYVSQLQVELGPVLLQVSPRLALQALEYWNAVEACDAASAAATRLTGEKPVPIKQMVLDSYKRNQVALSFALSALLPVLDVTCPQLALVAPLRDVRRLDSCTAAAAGAGGDSGQQAPPGAAVELVARMSKLHASVGYNSSCYSSLLQQVDATADMELVFVQAAAQQQLAQYAAVWMHPDDVQQLQEVAKQLPAGAAAGGKQQGLAGAPGSASLPVRQSLVRQSFVRPAAGQAQAGPAALGGPAPNRLPALSLPWLPATRPFVPVVRLQQVWGRLSTHIPTEPAVAGGEHTTAGCSAAGLLLFVSPWQVKLLLAAAEQLSSDLQGMLKRVKHKQQSAAEFAAAAGRAVATSAAQFALDEAQEAGSSTAAASKLTTAMMGATAAVSAANAAAGAVGRRARAHGAARGGSSAGASAPAAPSRQQQQAEFSAAAVQASRTAAKQASMSVLFVLPYCEVLCFADLAAGAAAGSAGGHRYPIQPQVLPQPLQPPGKPDQQQQQQLLLQQWSSRIAPVASLVLFGLRAGTTTGSDGCLAARLHMSSLLLVNLQLLDLCKSPATMPSAAGVYLPDSHVLPELSRAASSAGSAAAAASLGGRSSGTGAGTGRRPAGSPAAAGVSANYNAFVLSPFTARLTATYQAATLSRWQLVGLSRLAGSGSSSGGSGAPTAAAAAADGAQYVARGRISKRLLLRQRWQRVLELRAFARSLDYGMFLLFYQEGLRQWSAASGRSSWAGQQVDAAAGSLLAASAFEKYELLYRHGLDDAAVATAAATAAGSRVPNMHIGWFGSRRGTRASSSYDGAGSPSHSRRAAVAPAAAAAAAAADRSPTAGPGPVTALEQPGSPCNWRRSSFNRSLTAKLLAAEQASSSGGGASRSSSLPVSMGGGGAAAAAGEALARGLSGAGFSPSRGGAGPQLSSGGAASHHKTELPRVVGSAISSSAGSLSPTTSGVANMQVFSTLRNLRAGSASLLQSAAQQLKLRQLRQTQQQQQQRMQQPGGSPTVRLNSRGASCLSSMSRTEDLSLQQQGMMAAKLSVAGAAEAARQQSPNAGAAERGTADAVPPPVVDFLDRFAVSKYGTCISCSEGPGADWRLSSARQPDTPRSQQSSVTGGHSRLTSGLLQPQLAVTYTQQPAGQRTGSSARSGAAAGAAGLRGSAEQLGPRHSGGRAIEGQPQDALMVSLAHVKLAVGPHSVSMLLQLASCLMAAAGSAAGPRADGAAASTGSAAAQEQADEAAAVAAARAPSAAAKLRMRLQLVACHVRVNMEAAQLPGSCSGDQRLHTKGLLSLLLLDAASSVQQADTQLQQQPTEVADAEAAALAPGLYISCSVAHVGLQDLCACVEQRHVLSGADQPYKAAVSSPVLQLSRSRQHAACDIMARASVPASGSAPGQPLQLAVSVHNPRVVLVRRFANNVLYVAALINKEVEAAALAGSAGGSAGGSLQQPAEPAAPVAASEPAVVLLHLTNVQVILPHSHACTTLGNKYQKAWQLHKAAQASGRHSSADSNASSSTTTIGAGGGRSSKSDDSQEPATPAAAEGSGGSWTWGRQRQEEQHSSRGGRRSAAGGASPQEPLHAFYPEVLLLQVAQITVAAPAAPELLSQADADLQCEEHTGCSLPQWMAQEAAMQEMLASSAEIVTSSSAPPAQQPQPRSQPEQRAASGTQAADAAAAASAAAGSSAAAAGQQPHQPASAQAPFTVRTARSGVQPAAAVRHGVLIVQEGAPDAAELAAAARAAAAASALSLKDATRRLLKRAWAKVSPSSRRLVIRPGMALDGAALPGRRGAAGAGAAGAGARVAGQQPAGLPAAAVAAAGDAAGGAAGVVAYCLMDFSGFELLAGRMQREKSTPWRGVAQSSEAARLEAGFSPTGKCALTALSHLITRTSLQAAVHEHRAAAQRLPAPAAAARGPGAAAPEAASPASVLALAAPDGLAFQMSASSYRCLMDTLFGNLMNHSSSFERRPQPPSAAGPDGPGVMPATAFNPGVKFGPRPGQLPCFAVTLSSSSVQGTLLADNRWWTLPAEQRLSSGAGAGSGGEIVPFVSAGLQDAGLCVQMMRGTFDIHTDLRASNTEWRDVRMSSSKAASTQLSMLRRSTGEEAVHPLSVVSHEDVAAKAAGDRLAQTLQDDRDAATDRFLTPFAGVLDGDSDDDALGPAVPATGPGRYRRATPPATTSPAHLYSRLDRQPKERVDSPHAEGGSVEGVSSDEAVAEQQLATCDLFPALLQPSADGSDKGPDISVIRSLDELPAEESAHLNNKGKRPGRGAGAAGGAAANAAFRLHVGYTADHTLTTELVLSHVLLQWPYLTDMSLVSAIINVFYSDWGAAPKLPPSWLQLQRTAWLYFNLVITDSQLFMPLLMPHMATAAAGAAVVQEQQALQHDRQQQAAEQQQRRPKPPQQPEQQQQQRAVPSPFELLRDMVLKQAAGLTAADIYQGRGQPLEQLGLALTFGAFRFGYFYGGDGEAVTRYDVRNMAGFVRDRSALITNWLLPLPSASLELRQDYPLVEEHQALLRILLVLRKLLLWRRVRQRHRQLREQRRQQRQQHAGGDELAVPGVAGSEQLSGLDQAARECAMAGQAADNVSGSYATSAANRGGTVNSPEQRLLALACEHAEELFGERVTSDWHNTWLRQSHAHDKTGQFGPASSGMFGVYKRKARSELLVNIAPITLRAAFSNISAWKTLQADLQLASQSMSAGLGMWPPRPDIQPQVLAVRAAGGVWPPPPTGWAAEFRRSSMRVNVELAAVVLMLCDDKPHSFGAPDVLQAVARGVSLVHAQECRFPRTAAERADRLLIEGGVGVNILNNSSSKWEVLVEPWPLLACLSDPINPLAKADRTLYGQVLSGEPLRVNFFPSSLLSIGDLLAFCKEVSAVPAASCQQQQQVAPQQPAQLAQQQSLPPELASVLLLEEPSGGIPAGLASVQGSGGSGFGRLPPQGYGQPGPGLPLALPQREQAPQQARRRGLSHTEAPPSIEEQMALAEGLTSRIPQRYLIQNLTGSHLWYWAPEDDPTAAGSGGSRPTAHKRVFLAAHSMQELKVSPAPRRVRHLAMDGSLLSTGRANAISIQMAGSWLPLDDVAVDVVGKYRYEVRDPLGSAALPLLLDVLLVGRTKMLRLHSCLWLENNSGMRLEPVLQLGIGCSMPVVLGPGDSQDSLQRLHLRPLKPREGRFLPAAAALGGLLFLAPEGHEPSEHDVLRLTPSLRALKELQQGYITCQSKPGGLECGPVHLAATIHLGLQTDPYFTTQNLVEVPRPGTLRRAVKPLEATIRISPTLQLTNGLPYDVLGWVVVPQGRDALLHGGRAAVLQGLAHGPGAAAQKLGPAAGTAAAAVAAGGRAEDAVRAAGAVAGAASGAQPAGQQGQAPAAGSLSGMSRVWGASSRREAAMALAGIIQAARLSLQQGSSAAPAGATATSHRRRNSLFGARGPSVMGGDMRPALATTSQQQPHQQQGLQTTAHSRNASSTATQSGQHSRAVSEGGAGPAAAGGSSATGVGAAAGGAAAAAADDKGRQLAETCELLLLQRWCRDLLMEEFVTTLHLVLSPATAAAVDVTALWLLDLPALVALALGVLLEEFGWIAKSFPQVFALLLKLEESLASTAKAAAAAAEDGSESPSAATGAAADGAGGWQRTTQQQPQQQSQQQQQPVTVQMLPWPADQLPLVELLALLFWLQQHVVRLQLAPGAAADLYLDPQLDVYAAVRVPVLAMQSRPTLVSGGLATQAVGSDNLRLFYTSSLDASRAAQQQQQLLLAPAGASRHSAAGGGSGSCPAGVRLGLLALQVLRQVSTVHEEVKAKMTETARLLAQLVNQQRCLEQQQQLLLQQQGFSFLLASTSAAGRSVTPDPYSAARGNVPRLQSYGSAPSELVLPLSSHAADEPLGLRVQQPQQPSAAALLQEAEQLLPWFSVVVQLLSDVVQLALHEGATLRESAGTAGSGGICVAGPADSTSCYYSCYSYSATTEGGRGSAGGSGGPGTVRFDVSPLQRSQAGLPEQLMMDLQVADTALALLGEALCLEAVQASPPPAAASSGPATGGPGSGQLQGLPPSHSSNNLAAAVEGDAASEVTEIVTRIRQSLPAIMPALCGLLVKPPADVERLFTQLLLDPGHTLTDKEVQTLLDFSCQALADTVLPPPSAAPTPELASPSSDLSAAAAAGRAAAAARLAGTAAAPSPTAGLAAAGPSGGGAPSPRSRGAPRPAKLPPVWQDNVAFGGGGGVDGLNQQGSTVIYEDEPEADDDDLQLPWPLPPPPTPAGLSSQAQQLEEDEQASGPGNEEAGSELEEEDDQGPAGSSQGVVRGSRQQSGSTAVPPGPMAAAAVAPLRGLRSLRTLMTAPNLAGSAGGAGQAASAGSAGASGSRGGNAAAAASDAGAGPASSLGVPAPAAGPAASGGSGSAGAGAAAAEITAAGPVRPLAASGGGFGASDGGVELPGGLRTSIERLWRPRLANSSNDDSDDGSGDDAVSPMVGSSFRRRPGASVRALARNVRRAGVAPGRMVHQRLSTQLRHALEHQMQQLPLSASAAGAPEHWQGTLVQQGLKLASMHLQALGLGAVAAEVQEGRPGFCAPPALTVSLMHSGGKAKPSDSGSGKASRSGGGGSATRQVLMTAAFWLDNRSGLNLVLSDLDRRVLRGLPGPGLKFTADVHSPGLPRDCAALESDEPDLAALLAAGGSGSASASRPPTAASMGGSHIDLAQAAAAAEAAARGAGACASYGGFGDADGAAEEALARLQEVRPALLNEQAWLRFWVEEHVVVPAGSKPHHRSRRTFSFNRGSAGLTTNPGSSAGGNSSLGGGGDSSLQPNDLVHAFRSEASGFFKISVTGSKSDIRVKGHKTMAVLAPSTRQTLADRSASRPDAASAALGDGFGPLASGAAASSGLIRPDPEHALVVPVQRLFEFAAEVWPAPADGPFRATKVVSIKSKFILFNDTGMGLEYKQKGTPDIGHPRYLSYGEGRRFAGLLQPQERVAFHWDNIFEPRQLLIRPAAPGWPWSGAFPLPDKEDYFGLRLRNRCSDAAVIIPVNSTVGRSGCVLITFKSTSSVPPYRIENRTKSVQLNLRQLVDAGSGRATAAGTGAVHGSGGLHRHGSIPVRKEQSAARPMGLGAPGSWDSLAPGSSLPFAWDEITARHTVEVAAEVLAPGARLGPGTAARPISGRSKNVYAFDLDTLQKQHVLELRSTTRTMRNTGSPATSADGAAAQPPVPGSQQQQQDSMRAERQQQPEAPRQLRMAALSAMHARSGVFFPPDTTAAGSSSSLKSGSRAGFRGTPGSDASAVGSPRNYAAGSSGDGSSDAARAAAASASAASAPGAHSVAVFDRKVYVTVYADGPTKVLCFSDEEAVGAAADGEEGGTQQLMSRLHQVARQLMQADKQLAAFVGPSYNIRAAKNTRAVPATLLMQQQQQHAAAVAAAAGGSGGTAAQQPLAMQPAAGGWYGSSQTTMAAVAMLQKLSLQEMVAAAAAAEEAGHRQAHHGHLRSTDSAHGAVWAPAAAAAAAAMRTGQLLMEADSLQGGLPAAGAQDQLPGAAPGAPAPSGPSASTRLLPAAQSHISSRALAGAAAAAGAGVRVDPVTGLLSADTGPDGGLKLYYDKLTLLLDSGLPLGGNCKVKLLSARGLGAAGGAGGDRYIGGCVARLAATGRPAVLSGVVQLAQRLRDGEQEVVWDHEEVFTEVTALCELVVDLWGVPSGSILGGRRHHHGSTRPAPAAAKPASAGGRAPPGSGAGGSGKGTVKQAVTATAGNTVISSAAQIPGGSIFLGTVNIPLIHTLPGTATAGRGPRWFSLLRRSGVQHVTGEVQLGFSWSFTRETLLACELAELERLLAARQEVLAMLRPLSAVRVARLMGLPAAAAADSLAAAGEPGSGQARAGSLEAPVPAGSAGWNEEEDDDDSDGASLMSDGTADSSFVAAAAAGPDDAAGSGHQHQRSSAAAGAAGAAVARLPSIVTCRDVFAGLDLGMADSSVVGLEVGVVEVANLSPRSGWSQDLTHALLSAAGGGVRAVGQGSSMVLTETVKRADLPLPVVYVFCGAGGSGDRGFEVSAGSHSLNPLFAINRFLFEHVGLRSLLRVQVYDRRSALDSRLLGLASLPAAAIPAASSGPVYMWVPLLPPDGKKRGKLARLQGYLHGGLPAGASATTTLGSRSAPRHQVAAPSPFLPHSQRQPLQVLLRVRVIKPPTHNTTAALQLNLAGMLLNAKADGGDELLNLSVDAVQCALLNTTRQRQLTLSVLRLQLDNQTLATRHPVVLSPATMGEEAATRSEPILATDKTLDDMDSPARALMAALSRPVPKPGSISGPGAGSASAATGSSSRAASSSTAAAAGIRQLQLASSGSSGVGALSSRSPLIRLSVCQTLTKPLAGTGRSGSEPGGISASSSATDVAAAAAAGSSGPLPHAASSASLAVAAATAAAAGASGGGASGAESAVSKAAIVSFKKVELLIGAMDIKTDQSFLEAVYIFMQSMPLPDLWQDEAWQHHVALLQGTMAEAADADVAASPAQQVAARPLTAGAGAAGGAGPLVARQQQLSASAANRLAGHARTRSFGAPAAFLDQLDLAALQLSGQAQAGPSWPPAVLPAAVVAPPAAAGGPSFGGGQLLPAAGAASAGGAGGSGRAARRAAAAQRAALSSALVLAWLPGKNDTELASMKGQSSTWLFFEAFHISSVCVNVTIALTSSFRTAAGGQPGSGSGSSSLAPGLRSDGSRASDAAGEDGGWRIDAPGRAGLSAAGMLTEVQRGVVRSMVNRVSGNSGLQLINVSDVGLTLGGVELSNRLLNQVGLRSYLVRHYTWRAVAQARKVLGGAGPGLAQVPASIIWAGFSVFDIGREVTRGKRSPLHFLPALLHVAFTLVSQLVGVSSRLTMAMLALVPVERSGGLSDHAALQRYVRMPSTAGEAFYQAACELYWGTAAGVAGLLLDPAAGLRLPGALGVAGGLVGLMKGGSGLMVRPVVGALDATSKCLRGFGLLCLGRRGIQGKLVRRVRAPGALDGAAAAAAAAGTGGGGSDGVSGVPGDEPDLHAALVASWQARLPALHPALAGDTVMEVLATRSCRLLLLTRRRLLYLRASLPTRGAAAGSCSYSLRWLLECEAVDHVRGAEEALKIFLEYHGCLRVPDFKRWGKGGKGSKGKGQASKEEGGRAAGGDGEAADDAVDAGGGGGQPGQLVVAGSGREPRGGDSRAVLLRLPLHHSLRCASPEVYQRVIRAVSRHLVQAAAATAAAEAAHRGHHAAAAAAAQAAEAVAGPGAGLLAGEPAASADAVLGEEAVGAAGRAQLTAQSYAELYAVV